MDVGHYNFYRVVNPSGKNPNTNDGRYDLNQATRATPKATAFTSFTSSDEVTKIITSAMSKPHDSFSCGMSSPIAHSVLHPHACTSSPAPPVPHPRACGSDHSCATPALTTNDPNLSQYSRATGQKSHPNGTTTWTRQTQFVKSSDL